MGLDSGDAKTLMAVGTGRALGSRLKRVNEPMSVQRFQQATNVAAIQP